MLVRLSLLLGLSAASLLAQSSQAARVLVVYAANDAASSYVAAYYANQRAVPTSNLCAITLPDPGAGSLDTSDYAALIQTPVQNCLNAIGRENILYIVLAYVRPYAIDTGTALYAIDSYMSDIWDQYTTQIFDPYPTRVHPYYVENQSQGNVFTPFQSLATYRAIGGLPLIYSVWRLDGATPTIATGLVDQALAAEAAGGPITQIVGAGPSACIDMELDPSTSPDAWYRTGDWDLFRAAEFLSATNYFNLITDTFETTFGNPPSGTCPNTGIYAGWYNYGTYNDAFSWIPGSIGWDLNSSALQDPRFGPNWSTNALQKGIAVTSGPMAEPYLEGLPRPSGVIRNLLEGANVGDAFLRNTRWLKWRILNVGDPLYAPYANKVPPFDAPLSVDSLSFMPRELVGGQGSVTAIVTVDSPAPAGGLNIALASSSSDLSVPSSVIIPEGTTTAAFSIATGAVGASESPWITASTPLMSVRNTVILDPLLSGVEPDQDQVQGGQTLQASVFLNASASLGGVTVYLASDQPAIASVPDSVFVKDGLSEANFAIQTSPVSANTTVNITSSYGPAASTVSLTVTP